MMAADELRDARALAAQGRLAEARAAAQRCLALEIGHEDALLLLDALDEMDTPASDDDWRPGAIVDARFEIRELLGQGGMGRVFRVHDFVWQVDLAVKSPLPVAASPEARYRFLREAQVWIDLGAHPNIVQCWFVRDLGGLRLFLEYLAGNSLADWLHAPGTRAVPQVLDLFVQACDGLAFAHARGIVHRDVKPSNLLLDRSGARLCVTDFGIVRYAGEAATAAAIERVAGMAAQTGSGLGTPAYGAPEQWRGAVVDARADVYALGVSLFEALTKRRPFDAGDESAQSVIARHLAIVAPDVREHREDVPKSVANIVRTCLRKDPGERFQTMAELRDALVAARQRFGSYRRPVPSPAHDRAHVVNNRLASFHDLGLVDEARRGFAGAVVEHRNHAELLYNAAMLDWRAGEIHDLEVVRRLDSAPSAGRWLGEVHLERGDCDGARRALEIAVLDEATALDPGAWIALGDAQLGTGDEPAARASYAAAAERVRRPGMFGDRLSRRDGIAHVGSFSGGRTLAITHIAVSTVTNLVVTGHWNGEEGHPGYGTLINSELPVVQVWNLETRAHVRSLGASGYTHVETMRLSIDGRVLVVDRHTIGYGSDGATRGQEVWDIVAGRQLAAIPRDASFHERAPTPAVGADEQLLAVLPGEQLLIANSKDGAVRVRAGERCRRTLGEPRSWHNVDSSVVAFPHWYFVAAPPVGDGARVLCAQRDALELWRFPAAPPSRPLAWSRAPDYRALAALAAETERWYHHAERGFDAALEAFARLRELEGQARDARFRALQRAIFAQRAPRHLAGTWIVNQIPAATTVDPVRVVGYRRDGDDAIAFALRDGEPRARFPFPYTLFAARDGVVVGRPWKHGDRHLHVHDDDRDRTWAIELDVEPHSVEVVDREHALVLSWGQQMELRLVHLETRAIAYGVSLARAGTHTLHSLGPTALTIERPELSWRYARTGALADRLGPERSAATISPDGRYGLVVRDPWQRGEVTVIDFTTPGAPVAIGPLGRPGHIAWCGDFAFYSREFEGHVHVVHAPSGKHVAVLDHDGRGGRVAITEDGDCMAIVSGETTEIRELDWEF